MHYWSQKQSFLKKISQVMSFCVSEFRRIAVAGLYRLTPHHQIVQISYELYMHSCHQRYTTSEKICTMTNYIPWVLQHAEGHQSLTPPWSMYVLQMAMEERWLKDIWNAALDRGQEGSAYTLAILQFLFLASKHDHFVVVNTCPEKIVLSKQHNQNMGVRK